MPSVDCLLDQRSISEISKRHKLLRDLHSALHCESAMFGNTATLHRLVLVIAAGSHDECSLWLSCRLSRYIA